MPYIYVDKSLENYIINQRRYFHENPELSWQEENTSSYILKELKDIGIDAKKILKTGVLGVINQDKKGKVLAIRADIDALPIVEETDLDFKSTNNGAMHACGHDSHAAMLLGAAKKLSEIKDEIGKVVLLFQPAEEYIKDSGAKHVVKEQILENEGVDRIITIHVLSTLEAGKAALNPGPIMASSDTFEIEILGRGGHGSEPNLTIDPITTGSLLVQNLQNVVSREISPKTPMVLSITAFNAGNSENVIPDSAKLLGTTRTFDNDLREQFPEIIERIIRGVCESNRANYKFKYNFGTPATINDKEVAEFGNNVLKDIVGEEGLVKIEPWMAGEDFAKYLVNIPGALMTLGALRKGYGYPHHNSKFNIDESCFKLGTEYFIRYAVEYYKK